MNIVLQAIIFIGLGVVALLVVAWIVGRFPGRSTGTSSGAPGSSRASRNYAAGSAGHEPPAEDGK